MSEALRAKTTWILGNSGKGGRGSALDGLAYQINELTGERNRLAAAQAGQVSHMVTTMETIREAVLIVDRSDQVVLANKAFHHMFPGKENAVGKRVGLVLRNGEFLDFVAGVRRGGETGRREIEFPAGERSVWVEVSGSLIPGTGGTDQPCLFVLHDITRLKRLESVRKEFVANVSHELRTPLSMIKGYAETLADPEQEISSADRQRFLGIIEKHANRLHLLLEDLLVLSRLEGRASPMHSEPALLEDVVRDVAGNFSQTLQRRGQSLRMVLEPDAAPILLDVSKMTQVVGNLLDNAAKYSPEGAIIEIGTKYRSDEIEFWVKDNGPGIAAADLPHIFERFYRVDKGRSRETGGTGLGLSIVKHITQLHGGRVWAESKIGAGTRFALVLPREIPTEKKATGQEWPVPPRDGAVNPRRDP